MPEVRSRKRSKSGDSRTGNETATEPRNRAKNLKFLRCAEESPYRRSCFAGSPYERPHELTN